MIKLGELVMILELHRQGSRSAIARQLGIDRKTVRTYIAKGLEPPAYKKRAAGAEHRRSLRALFARAPGGLSRPDRAPAVPEIKERGYYGGYSAVTDCCANFGRPQRRTSKSASRRRLANRRRSTSPGSMSSSPTSRRQAHRLALLDGARLFPADLGALRPPPGSAERPALPYRRLRGDRRRAARDPLRSHEDRRHRRGCWTGS